MDSMAFNLGFQTKYILSPWCMLFLPVKVSLKVISISVSVHWAVDPSSMTGRTVLQYNCIILLCQVESQFFWWSLKNPFPSNFFETYNGLKEGDQNKWISIFSVCTSEPRLTQNRRGSKFRQRALCVHCSQESSGVSWINVIR